METCTISSSLKWCSYSRKGFF